VTVWLIRERGKEASSGSIFGLVGGWSFIHRRYYVERLRLWRRFPRVSFLVKLVIACNRLARLEKESLTGCLSDGRSSRSKNKQ
jgi:hypothetical protein